MGKPPVRRRNNVRRRGRFHAQAWTWPSFAPRRCRPPGGGLNPAHDRPNDPQHRARAAQPDRRRRRRQRRQGARGARRGGRGTAPTSSCSPSCSSPAIRRRTWCSSRPSRSLPRGLRGARARDRRRRAGVLDRARPGPRTASSTTPMRCSTAAQIAALRFKVDLPNYGVFDEKRVFTPGPLPGPVVIRGVRIGMPICEDIWGDEVVECIAETGGEILLVPNGSPYWRGKTDERMNIAAARVTETGLPLVYLNQVGGQDELVFDGASFVAQRRRRARLPDAGVREAVALTRLGEGRRAAGAAVEAPLDSGRGGRRGRLRRLRARACATTSTRTAFRASCSGFPAASIRRSAPRSRSTRSGPTGCTASCCPTATPRTSRCPTPPTAPSASASATTSCRSRAAVEGFEAALKPLFAGQARATSPRRTSRPAPAARS